MTEKASRSLGNARYLRASLFTVGVLATIPILSVPFTGERISIYSLLFAILTAVLLGKSIVDRKSLSAGSFDSLSAWLILCLFSCACGFVYFYDMPAWRSAVFSYIPKVFLFLLFYIGIRNHPSTHDCGDSIINGILLGSALNVLWAIADYFCYTTLGFSLTNRLFSSYIQANSIRYGQLSLITQSGFRSSGLCGDPANVGLFSAILFGYALFTNTRRGILTIVSVLAVGASSSVSGATCMILVFVVWCIKSNFLFANLSQAGVVMFALGVLIILWIMLFRPEVLIQLQAYMQNIMDRFVSKTATGSESLRWAYYTDLPTALSNVYPPLLITGTGFGAASYPYLCGVDVVSSLEAFRPYDPESVYVAYIFDCGLPGFSVYIVMLMGFLKESWNGEDKHSRILVSAVLVTLFSGFFYHYIFYSVSNLIFVAAACQQAGRNGH